VAARRCRNEDANTLMCLKSGRSSTEAGSKLGQPFFLKDTQEHEGGDPARVPPLRDPPWLDNLAMAEKSDASVIADTEEIDSSVTDQSRPLSLVLDDYLGRGRLHTTYKGYISSHGNTILKCCVAKLVDLRHLSRLRLRRFNQLWATASTASCAKRAGRPRRSA